MIEAYIFDQDGTLYPERSRLTDQLREKTKQWLMKGLNIDCDEVEKLYKSLPETRPNPFDGFLSLGLTVRDYHKEVFDKVNPIEHIERNEELIAVLKRIKEPKFIVTFASKNYSYKLHRVLGIEDLIENVLFVSDFYPESSKLFVYEHISRIKVLHPNKICVVGNNFYTDILPALEYGFQTILIGKRDPNYKGRRIDSVCQI